MGRFVVKVRWETIPGDFDIEQGNLPGVGLAVMALCPLLALRGARSLGNGSPG